MEPLNKHEAAKHVPQNANSHEAESKLQDLLNECYVSKDFQRFLKLSDEWLRKDSSLADAIFFVRRAHSFYALGLYDQAIANAEKATLMNSHNPLAFAIMGFSQSRQLNSLVLQQEQRPIDVQQKTKIHLQLSLSSLLKARNLDSAIAESQDFKIAWDACMRELGRLAKLPGFQLQQAEPFSVRIKSGGDKTSLRPTQPESDEMLLNRSADMCLCVFHPDDSVIIKSEILFLLARLSVECLNPHNKMGIWDPVRNVRVLFQYQNALLQIEQKLGYDSQLPSWQADRHAWRFGVATATTPGAVLILLHTLRKSLRSWGLEKSPERVTKQIRLLLTDLEAFGDEDLGSAFAGECQRVRLALITLAMRELKNDMVCELMIDKARILENDRCYAESLRLLNDVVSLYNADECSEIVMRTALKQRDVIQDKMSLQEQQSLVLVNPKQAHTGPPILTSLGSAPAMKLTSFSGLDPFNVKNQTEQDVDSTSSAHQWKSLDAKQRAKCAEFSVRDLKSKLGPVMMESVHCYLDSIGKTEEDILGAYCQLPPVNRRNGEQLAGMKDSLTDVPEPKLENWPEFQSALDHLLLKALVLHQLVDEQMANSQETIPTIKPFNGRLSCLPFDDQKQSLVFQLLRQRQEFPSNFSDEAVCDGWQTRISKQLRAKYESQSSVGDAPNTLLFDDVYFVVPRGPDEPYSNGRFVSEVCARTCHADRKRIYIGRLPFASECGEGCKLQRGSVSLRMNLVRTSGESFSVSNMEESSILRSQPRRGLFSVLRDIVLREEPEAKMIEKYLAVYSKAESAEKIIERLEQAKFGAEQVVNILDRFHFLNRRVLEDSYEAKDTRFAEEAIQAAVDVMELWQAEGVDPTEQFPRDVHQTLMKCASLLAYRMQIRGKLQDARASLLIEEENLASALPAADPDWIEDVHSIQTELAKDEKLQKLHAKVVSLTQNVTLLGSQLAQVESHLRVLSIVSLKKYHQHIRWSALMEVMTLSSDLLEDLLSGDEASGELQQTVASIRQAHIQNVDGLAAMPMHERVNVAEAAIRLLHVLPETLSQRFAQWNDLDEAWMHFEQAGDKIRALLLEMCVSLSLNLPVNSSQEMTQTIDVGRFMASIISGALSREWPQYVECVAHERWRRAELMKSIHFKIQSLYFAIGEIMWDRLEELKSVQTQDAVLRELLDEEERLLKEKAASKASKKKAKRKDPPIAVAKGKSSVVPVSEKGQMRNEIKPELQQGESLFIGISSSSDDSTKGERKAAESQEVRGEKVETGLTESPSQQQNGQSEDDASEWITVGKRSSATVGKEKKNKHGVSTSANGTTTISTVSKPTKPSVISTKQEKSASIHAQNGRSSTQTHEKQKNHSKSEHSKVPGLKDLRDNLGSAAAKETVVNGTISEYLAEEDETSQSSTLISEDASSLAAESESTGVNASEPIEHMEKSDLNGYAAASVQEDVAQQPQPKHFGHLQENGPSNGEMVYTSEHDQGLYMDNPPFSNGDEDVFSERSLDIAHENQPMPPPLHFMPPVHPSQLRGFPAHPSWICPLSGEIMLNPVTAADGCNYDQYAIMAWLSNSRVSPVSGAPLAHDTLVPNFALRQTIWDAIARYTSSHPGSFGMPPVPPPMRPVCVYFQKGTCRYGAGCHNLHIPPLGPHLVQPPFPPPMFGTGPPSQFAMAPPYPYNISTAPPPFPPPSM